MSYLSPAVCDELVFIMGRLFWMKLILKSRALVTSPYQWIRRLMSNTDELTCVICYVLSSFCALLPMMQHTGLELATRLLTFLDQHGIDIKKYRGQSYNNASNMSEMYNGMQSILLEKCQFAAFIPCAAHSLNLVGKSAAECCTCAVRFFDFMNQRYTYFSAPPHLWRVLEEALGPCGLVFQKLSTTRWSQ